MNVVLQILKCASNLMNFNEMAGVEHSVCRECGDEVIFAEQIKRNDCILRDAWRKIDGLLTAQEIVDLRNKLGLTQQDAAKVFGGGVNAFSKYERSEVIQSVAMDKLMRAALEFPSLFLWLKQQAGLLTSDYGSVKPLVRKKLPETDGISSLNYG